MARAVVQEIKFHIMGKFPAVTRKILKAGDSFLGTD
jgi:hypothetical protein